MRAKTRRQVTTPGSRCGGRRCGGDVRLLVRPWHLRWGATEDKACAPLLAARVPLPASIAERLRYRLEVA